MKTIKIALTDDHPIIVKGVSSLINDSLYCELVFTAGNRHDLLSLLKTNPVDILILDVVMPDVSATELFSEILADYPSLGIIAYTSLNSPILIKMLFRAGVQGYVNKNDPPEYLLKAIDTISNRALYIGEQYQHLIEKKTADVPGISKREKEILLLIADQYTTTAIAEKLFISVNTVETHRKKLFEKFNVENLAGLVKEAMRQGYIS